MVLMLLLPNFSFDEWTGVRIEASFLGIIRRFSWPLLCFWY